MPERWRVANPTMASDLGQSLALRDFQLVRIAATRFLALPVMDTGSATAVEKTLDWSTHLTTRSLPGA